MKRALILGALGCVLIAGTLLSEETAEARGGRGNGPIIYVTSQGLFYDSIVTADPLPMRGPFQKLVPGGPAPADLETQYGPGDPEYLGGRWWMDSTSKGERDEDDHFWSCPLLGPGREERGRRRVGVYGAALARSPLPACSAPKGKAAPCNLRVTARKSPFSRVE